MPVSAEQLIADTQINARGILDQHGITMDALAKQLKQELKAKETKFYKIKGAKGWTSKRGLRVVARSEEEALIAIDVAALGIRQAARISAHQLRGDFPKTQVEHSGAVGVDLTNAKDILSGRLLSEPSGGGSAGETPENQ